MWLGPAAADVHDIAGPHLRGLGIGIYFFSVNIAAYARGLEPHRQAKRLGSAFRRIPSKCDTRFSSVQLHACIAAFLLWRGSRSLGKESNV